MPILILSILMQFSISTIFHNANEFKICIFSLELFDHQIGIFYLHFQMYLKLNMPLTTMFSSNLLFFLLYFHSEWTEHPYKKPGSHPFTTSLSHPSFNWSLLHSSLSNTSKFSQCPWYYLNLGSVISSSPTPNSALGHLLRPSPSGLSDCLGATMHSSITPVEMFYWDCLFICFPHQISTSLRTRTLCIRATLL